MLVYSFHCLVILIYLFMVALGLCWASQVALIVKNLPANVGDERNMGLISVLGRFPWRKKWQPTPVFLAGEFHGQRSLVGCSPWGYTELDTTEPAHSHILGHCCCMWAFSSCSVWASHCSGFSCCRARTLGTWTSLVVALRLSSCVLVL